MPHTRSAKKRLRQTEKRNHHNRELKKDIKIQTKKLVRALEAGDTEAAQTELNVCYKKLDRAGAKRLMHPNKAARKKSQLARLVREKTASGDEA